MQFKQEQMEFVNQLLYPILMLKKEREEERPSSALEKQLVKQQKEISCSMKFPTPMAIR